jgi:putative ABC transport system permease protein
MDRKKTFPWEWKPMIFEEWWQDLRLAWRGLCRARGFTGAAVLTLAVGIAGTTVMFALIEGVLLRPLPVLEQDRLLVAWKELRSAGVQHWPFRVREIDALSKESQTLERVAGVDYNGALSLVAVENGSASYLSAAAVTGDFFGVLGVEPIFGRAINRYDDLSGAENVLMITYRLWQRRYGGARDVIGRRVMVRERPFTVVGVMPADVEYPRGVEAWMTVAALRSTPTNPAFRDGPLDVDLIARLRPGATIAQAASELHALVARFEADEPPGIPRSLTPVVRSYKDVVVRDMRAAMLVLFGAVGLVLIIATANVANLLLMRGEARRAELAVRAALGAGRGRLARQLLAESVVLALAAGSVGLVVTWWSLQALVALVPNGLPRVDSVHIDAGVIAFTVGVAFLTIVLAGLAPALSSTRTDLASELRSGGRGTPGTAAQHARRALVVTQVALAVTIVAAAGLLTRSLLRLQAVDMGLAADRLVFVQLALPEAKYAERARHLQFLNDVVAELEAAPAIEAATPVNTSPFAGTNGWDLPVFTAEGQSAERVATNPSLNLESIHPNYFETFKVTLVGGRGFTEADRQGAPDVAIVSEDVAARTWPGEDPIGKRMKFGGVDSQSGWRTVVGVVRPTRYRELAEPRATLYLPAEQFIVAAHMLVLRTGSPLTLVTGLARERVRAVDPDVQVMRVAPFPELLDGPLARPRFNAFLIAVFGVAALLLAAIGLYAVMAASVRRRYTEIGVRVALGATPSDVCRLVLWEGVRLATLGAAIGLAIAMVTTRLLRGLLYDVHPLDPAALLAAGFLVVGTSVLASYLPARRATRVDPVAMLRAN